MKFLQAHHISRTRKLERVFNGSVIGLRKCRSSNSLSHKQKRTTTNADFRCRIIFRYSGAREVRRSPNFLNEGAGCLSKLRS